MLVSCCLVVVVVGSFRKFFEVRDGVGKMSAIYSAAFENRNPTTHAIMSSIVVDIFTDQSENTLNVVWKRFNSVEVDVCNGQMTYGSCSVVSIWKGAYGVRTLPKCHSEPVCH